MQIRRGDLLQEPDIINMVGFLTLPEVPHAVPDADCFSPQWRGAQLLETNITMQRSTTMTESMNPNMPERLARRDNNLAVVERFYLAAATHDTSKVVPVLTEDFVGTTTEGLPNGLGGVYHGNENAVARIWGRIWSLFDMNGEVYEFLPVDDDRVIVLGRYVGHTQDGSSPVFAAFAHIFTVRGDRVAALRQITDSAQWQQFGTRAVR
jgi:2-(1,2-epoxy-1,2-dihydrophenyl)acetyl-CoA isomerase